MHGVTIAVLKVVIALSLICGGAFTIAGVALLVVVMRRLLAQAIERDAEAQTLRAELDEVV